VYNKQQQQQQRRTFKFVASLHEPAKLQTFHGALRAYAHCVLHFNKAKGQLDGLLRQRMREIFRFFFC
jgi:hypothetical protein